MNYYVSCRLYSRSRVKASNFLARAKNQIIRWNTGAEGGARAHTAFQGHRSLGPYPRHYGSRSFPLPGVLPVEPVDTPPGQLLRSALATHPPGRPSRWPTSLRGWPANPSTLTRRSGGPTGSPQQGRAPPPGKIPRHGHRGILRHTQARLMHDPEVDLRRHIPLRHRRR